VNWKSSRVRLKIFRTRKYTSFSVKEFSKALHRRSQLIWVPIYDINNFTSRNRHPIFNDFAAFRHNLLVRISGACSVYGTNLPRPDTMSSPFGCSKSLFTNIVFTFIVLLLYKHNYIYCDKLPRRPKCLVTASVVSTVPSTAVIVQRAVTNY
jgi:hypothetical protein